MRLYTSYTVNQINVQSVVVINFYKVAKINVLSFSWFH